MIIDDIKLGENVFIAPGAVVKGKVSIGDNSNVWYNSTLRGDRGVIIIGKNSNIQDNAVIHEGTGLDTVIGDYVSIGHSAIIHGCTIADDTIIGMGAILMNGCKIGSHCIIGAGAIVTEGKEIPDNSVVLGNPGKIVRQVKESELKWIHGNAVKYVAEAKDYMENP